MLLMLSYRVETIKNLESSLKFALNIFIGYSGSLQYSKG